MRCELTQFPILNVVTYCNVIFGNRTPQTRLDKNCSVSDILKTVCDCRELSSHRRQDKTRQSCLVGVGGVNEALLCGKFIQGHSAEFYRTYDKNIWLRLYLLLDKAYF